MFLIYTEINGIHYHCGFKINGNTTEEVYKSLAEICDIINRTISRFENENLDNNDAIYREIKGNIDYSFSWKKINDGVQLFKKIKSVIKLF